MIGSIHQPDGLDVPVVAISYETLPTRVWKWRRSSKASKSFQPVDRPQKCVPLVGNACNSKMEQHT